MFRIFRLYIFSFLHQQFALVNSAQGLETENICSTNNCKNQVLNNLNSFTKNNGEFPTKIKNYVPDPEENFFGESMNGNNEHQEETFSFIDDTYDPNTLIGEEKTPSNYGLKDLVIGEHPALARRYGGSGGYYGDDDDDFGFDDDEDDFMTRTKKHKKKKKKGCGGGGFGGYGGF